MNNTMKESFKSIYTALENNPKEFVDFFKENNFSTEAVDTKELSQHYDITVEKYKAFLRLLFPTLLVL